MKIITLFNYIIFKNIFIQGVYIFFAKLLFLKYVPCYTFNNTIHFLNFVFFVLMVYMYIQIKIPMI